MASKSDETSTQEAPPSGIGGKIFMLLVKGLQVYITFSIVSGAGGIYAVQGQLMSSYYYLIYASFALSFIDVILQMILGADSDSYQSITSNLSAANTSVGTGLVNALAASTWGATGDIVALLKYLVQYQIMISFVVAGLANLPIMGVINAIISAITYPFVLFFGWIAGAINDYIITPINDYIVTPIVNFFVCVGAAVYSCFEATFSAIYACFEGTISAIYGCFTGTMSAIHGCFAATLSALYGCYEATVTAICGRRCIDIECGGSITEKSGWITKDWRNQYYFILKNGEMKYYNSVLASRESAVGSILLRDFVLAASNFKLQANVIILESLKEKNKSITLTCYSPLHVEEWRGALEHNIKIAKSAMYEEVVEVIETTKVIDIVEPKQKSGITYK